jgi:hypothetical protein
LLAASPHIARAADITAPDKEPGLREAQREAEKILRWFWTFSEATTYVRVVALKPERDGHAPWSLEGLPIDVSTLLHERLWSRLETGVFCSATLATHGDGFGFFARRSGVGRVGDERVTAEVLPHVFDYCSNALLILPAHLPTPRDEALKKEFPEAVASELLRFIPYFRGRTLGLFTARSRMRMVHEALVQVFEKARFTFDEAAALGDAWRTGEDIRLREDPRFWELEQLGHFHLSHHRLSNDLLATRLWQGVWDGRDVARELAALDAANNGQFHVFCQHDPRFVEKDGQLFLVARPRVELPPNIQTTLDTATQPLLQRHRDLGMPLTTLQVREHLDVLSVAVPEMDDVLDTIEGWLRQRREWTEVARSLWLPTDLLPALEPPKPFHVLCVHGRDADPAIEMELIDILDDRSDAHASPGAVALPDPPVERHPDSSITWTHVLRTIHLQGIYLPVPVGARFRYPRFVGAAGNMIVQCVVHDSGREGPMWLDRAHNRFFGEILRELLEWEDSGRKLHLHWRPEAVVIRRGEIDQDVREEECRHVDPKALHELRLGKGESYRQALVSILRSSANGLDFRSLCTELATRQGHRPSRATIRTVLCQSPGFILKDGSWRSRDVPDSASVFRRRVILSAVTRSGERTSDLAELARAVGKAIEELLRLSYPESWRHFLTSWMLTGRAS